jgi:hypothetical protein
VPLFDTGVGSELERGREGEITALDFDKDAVGEVGVAQALEPVLVVDRAVLPILPAVETPAPDFPPMAVQAVDAMRMDGGFRLE